MNALIKAMVEEYNGYIAVGKPKRAAEVAKELDKLGYSTDGVSHAGDVETTDADTSALERAVPDKAAKAAAKAAVDG